MYRFTWIAKLSFLLTLPSLIFPADCPLPSRQGYPIASSPIWNLSQPFSYDDVIELIDEIESGDLEHCSSEELDRINQFIALLATRGILPHETDYGVAALNQDIQSLIGQSSNIGYSLNGEWYAAPLTFNHNGEILLSKSWVKKKWDCTRKFVKKYKTEIIIGTVVVVATVAVVVVTCGTGTGAVAGVAGAALGGTLAGTDETSSPSHSRREEIAVATIVPEAPLLQGVIEDRVTSFKEMISENPEILIDHSFVDRARDFGAYLAHETLDSVQNVASQVTELGREIKQTAEYFGLDFTIDNAFFQRDLDASFFSGHETIDKVFGVAQAPHYSPEAKAIAAESSIDYTYAVLPPPGTLSGSSLLGEGRLAASQCNSTWGWAVGQPIQNKTWWGAVPKWSTVRARHWKNMAFKAKSNPEAYGYKARDIPRMERGLAPQQYNDITGQWESKELHHVPPQREGGLFDFIELWPDDHANLDPCRRLKR